LVWTFLNATYTLIYLYIYYLTLPIPFWTVSHPINLALLTLPYYIPITLTLPYLPIYLYTYIPYLTLPY
jgi:hypothetical protein